MVGSSRALRQLFTDRSFFGVAAMLHKETAPDRAIVQKVTQALSNHGLRSPCAIHIVARGGVVTLSGTIEYVFQRKNAVQTATGVPGVRRVTDQLSIKHRNTWSDHSNAPKQHPN
jgi:osmotically-inducible protein OsmY